MRFTNNFMGNLSMISNAAQKMAQLNVVELVTPVNANEQKALWLERGDFAAPSFRYDTKRLGEVVSMKPQFFCASKLIEQEVETVSRLGELAKKMIARRLAEAIAICDIAIAILGGHDERTAELMVSLYGKPNSDVTLAAYNKASEGTMYPFADGKLPALDAASQEALKALEFDAQEIATWFDRVIERYGFEGWLVAVDSKFTAIDVRDRSSDGSVVGIPIDRKVNGAKLIELIGHELESHMRSVENARRLWQTILGDDSPLDYFIPALAKSDNELLYEGFAKMSDIRNSGEAGLPLPYATVAIDQALRGHSFEEVAKVIYSYRLERGQSEKAAMTGAWTSTYRIFRGATNMVNPSGYAFTKDLAYLGGWELAQRTDPVILEYSSMTLEEIQALLTAGANLSDVPHPYKNAAGWVREQLLR